jgi:hypothetical protein
MHKFDKYYFDLIEFGEKPETHPKRTQKVQFLEGAGYLQDCHKVGSGRYRPAAI